MKKLICFLSLSLVLASCSSDDSAVEVTNPPVEVSDVYLKKIIETDADGVKVTTLYTYDGSKLQRMTSDDGLIIDFIYTGNLITKVEYRTDGILGQTDHYTYNSEGKMISFLRLLLHVDLGTKETYTYNANGSITTRGYSGDLLSQTTEDGEGNIFFENGEVSAVESNYATEHIYTYDTRNNPAMNVLGMEQISYSDSSASGILHNITRDEIVGDETMTISYEYNDLRFPTKSVERYRDEVLTTEYFYE